MTRKQISTFGNVAVAATSGLCYFARRAVIQKVDVEHAPLEYSVYIHLNYGPGLRPWSIIVDILAANGASGSASIDGEQECVTVPLSTSFEGTYMLTATATYRFFGIPRVVINSYSGVLFK